MKEKSISKKREEGLSNYVFGKVPPNVRDLEEAVLGAVMLEDTAFDRIADSLIEDAFYVEAHRIIWKAFLQLRSRNQPIDLLTVANEIRTMGKLDDIGGAFAMTDLTNRVTSTANIEYHTEIIMNCWALREHIKISNSDLQNCYEHSVRSNEIINRTIDDLQGIEQKLLGKYKISISKVMDFAYTEICERSESEDKLFGLPTRLIDFDRHMGGYPAELIVIAGRPGMGKTTYILNNIIQQTEYFNKKIGFISLEMSSIELSRKIISIHAGVDSEEMKKGKLSPEDMKKVGKSYLAVKEFTEKNLFIEDRAGLNIQQIEAIARRWKREHDIQALYIDYLQIISGINENGNGNREQEISNISRGLLRLKKVLGIPIIVLCQLNRDVEKRINNEPQLSDLRESGAIEQDADIVISLYRPEYYKVKVKEGQNIKNLLQIFILKYRNGSLGKIPVHYYLPTGAITDWKYFTQSKEEIKTNETLVTDEKIPF